jgi:hypothetical protein
MEMEISAFGLVLLAALTVVTLVVKRRSDVLHGPYIECGFRKRLSAIAAL